MVVIKAGAVMKNDGQRAVGNAGFDSLSTVELTAPLRGTVGSPFYALM